jgi:hypothetical protein
MNQYEQLSCGDCGCAEHRILATPSGGGLGRWRDVKIICCKCGNVTHILPFSGMFFTPGRESEEDLLVAEDKRCLEDLKRSADMCKKDTIEGDILAERDKAFFEAVDERTLDALKNSTDDIEAVEDERILNEVLAMSEEDIDKFLTEAGGDPKAIGERGEKAVREALDRLKNSTDDICGMQHAAQRAARASHRLAVAMTTSGGREEMKPGQRVPLCLAKIDGEWRSFRSEKSMRGHIIEAVVFLRRPTNEEKSSVRAGLVKGGPEHILWDLSVTVEDEGGRHKEMTT